ncbi:serine/threonine-protein kinase [Sorangium sp. So ce1036]|uniref:serine/threonine-protein kinase n=1 Tax=Sorangium sp. So ce1036 TaxID=3133328 RepID=UPI003F0E64EB
MLHAGDVAGGRFRLIRPIGSGGMASVWWARHELIGRDVALKLSPALRDEQVVGRFIREAKIIGKFQHRNIVGVVDAGELPDEGYLFLALELLRGAPFADRLIPNRPLPPEEVVPVLIEVCAGLSAAHAEGVVHRDIKPENIVMAMVPGEGIVPKIVDFGISQITGATDALTLDGQLLGTPSYMSPEQALGRRTIDARADLWAVGVMLYEALSGAQPFGGGNHHAVLRRILEAQPAPLPPSVPPRLRKIVGRCLEKDPARRYQDAASLRADLEAALDDLGACAPAPIVIVTQPDAGARAAEATRARCALAAPPLRAARALRRLWISRQAHRRLEATTLGSTPGAAPPPLSRRRARAAMALRVAAAAALAAALTSVALLESTGAAPESAVRVPLRPVLAAAFAEGGAAARRGAGPLGAAGGDAPTPAPASCASAAGPPALTPAAPDSAGVAADTEDARPRAHAPRGPWRSRVTSPGF